MSEEIIQLTGTEETVYNYFLDQGWTDGLPIIPPTHERVSRMMSAVDRDPEDVIAVIPPRWAELTVKKLAINAVMAGCLPEYLPVLISAIEAMCESPFNLYGVQATTNPVGPMLVVNGPVAGEIGLKGDIGALGPGWRANVTIGRAIRLVLVNVGGAKPGELDRATFGMPGKLFFCFAENEAENPWEPFHVEKGYAPDQSTVTVVGATGTLNLIDQGSLNASEILQTFVSALAIVGTNNVYYGGDPFLLLSPEHAQVIARGGFTKRSLKEYLFENAQVPLEAFSKSNVDQILRKRRPHLFEGGIPKSIPIADKPEDIQILVAGGPGKHSVFVPTFGVNRSVTKQI